MSKYIGPVCKLCRREGEKLFLKGARCLSPKCAFERRGFAPGMHGKDAQFRRQRISDYTRQLREKQKARRIYGVLEAQFRRYYSQALKKRGMTGLNLLQTLESRLDNVVYRLGFAEKRAWRGCWSPTAAARQWTPHRSVRIDGGAPGRHGGSARGIAPAHLLHQPGRERRGAPGALVAGTRPGAPCG
jgi:ribosomal protein S4